MPKIEIYGDLYSRLQAVAEFSGTTAGEIVGRLINDFLNENEGVVERVKKIDYEYGGEF